MGRALKKLGKKATPKERSQPSWRKKLGFLQKHEDYVIRSRAFHRRADQLKNLRRKAEFRNPDEFYFQMVNLRTKDGIIQFERKKETKQALKKFVKADIMYFTMKCQIEKKKLQRILESYHNLEKPPEGELYFESETERAAFIENFKAEARLRAQLDISEEDQEKFTEHIAKRKKQINDRINRVKDFERLLTQLNTKLQINCGKRKYKKVTLEKEDGTTYKTYQYRRERQR